MREMEVAVEDRQPDFILFIYNIYSFIPKVEKGKSFVVSC